MSKFASRLGIEDPLVDRVTRALNCPIREVYAVPWRARSSTAPLGLKFPTHVKHSPHPPHPPHLTQLVGWPRADVKILIAAGKAVANATEGLVRGLR